MSRPSPEDDRPHPRRHVGLVLRAHVFCYFNNDAEGNAVRDAIALRRLLGEEPPSR